MRVLIVGATGQLGRELQITAPPHVDILAPGRSDLDLLDRQSIERSLKKLEPELTINAAAYTAVDSAEDEPDRAFAVNATGAGWLAESVAGHSGRLLHVSTDFVFAGDSARPYDPGHRPAPLSVYGESKHRGEMAVQDAAADRVVIVRTAWLYSRYGTNFVKTMLRLLLERDVVDVVADQFGSPTWAKRLARALWEFGGRADLAGIFHWADDGTASWYELAAAIREEAAAIGLLQTPAALRPIATSDFPTRARRPSWSVLDCRKTWEALKIEPWRWRRSLRGMLAELKA